MILEVMCRIADGPLRAGKLAVTQTAGPLVTWSVDTCDVSRAWELQGNDLAIELHLPGDTVWTGEAYLADVGPDLQVRLRGTGVLRENSIPIHADVLVQRINSILGEDERPIGSPR